MVDGMSRLLLRLQASESNLQYVSAEECLSDSVSDAIKLTVAAREDVVQRWPFFVYLCGAMICLLTSAVSHLLCCKSEEENRLVWMDDYVVSVQRRSVAEGDQSRAFIM